MTPTMTYVWTGAVAGLVFSAIPLMFGISLARNPRERTLRPLMFVPVAGSIAAVMALLWGWRLSLFIAVWTACASGPGIVAAHVIRKRNPPPPVPETPPFYHPPGEPS